MKATTTSIIVLFVAILNIGAVLSAPAYHANLNIKRADALVSVYAPGGVVPGQPPGVVPTGKRNVELVEKSEELEDCAAPCDFYIRSVKDDDTSSPAYAVPGKASPILPRKVVPVGYYPFLDDENTNSKRAVEGAVAKAVSYSWPPGFKGPKSKRAVEGSLTEVTSASWPLAGFTGPRVGREEAVTEATIRPGFTGPRAKREETVAEATIRPGFTGPRSNRDEDDADCEPLEHVPTGSTSKGCDPSKRSRAKVPLNPVSGGYASGAPKRSEAKVPLNPASGGYSSGAPKPSEIDT